MAKGRDIAFAGGAAMAIYGLLRMRASAKQSSQAFKVERQMRLVPRLSAGSAGFARREDVARGYANLWGPAFGVPPALLMSVWNIESRFQPEAVNMTAGDARRGGAWGMAQVTLQTAKELDAKYPKVARQYWPKFHANPIGENLLDIRENTALSALLLSLGYREFGHFLQTGVGYKMGRGYVRRKRYANAQFPGELSKGAQKYWGRLTRAAQRYLPTERRVA